MELAPIGIITYSRIIHLRQTIESLRNNDLATKSELYIFLDGPRPGDEKLVNTVREYLYTIDGFKKVSITERKENDRVRNYRDGVNYLFDKYGKIIFLEDDNIVSPYFLQFMNDGLEFFKENKKIFSICGYNVPAKFPMGYEYDYYLSRYFNAWGFATWSDRNHLDVEDIKNAYSELLDDKALYRKVKKEHPKLAVNLKKIQENRLKAGDYPIVFHSIKHDLYSVKPIHSLVDNIGHDGSGIHCGISDRFRNDLNHARTRINFIEDIEYNQAMDVIGYKYSHQIFNRKLPERILRKIKEKINEWKNLEYIEKE